MKAIILAGGDGKRLRPMTCTMPKPLVPLLNKPTIFYTLELLKRHEINDVIITLGYMGDMLKRQVGDGTAFGLNITYSDSELRLGTAGSVRLAAEGIDDRILVLSGDGLTDADLTGALESHASAQADATVILHRISDPREYGIALTDKDGFITRFIEKPSRSTVFSDLANTGMYILEPSVIGLIPSTGAYDFSKDLFPRMLANNQKIFGFRMNGYWCDIGNSSQYAAAQRDMLDGKCVFCTTAKRYGSILMESDAHIAASAKLVGPCYIGNGVEIGDVACIEQYSILGSGAKLLNGVSVKRSVIMRNAILRSGAEVRGAIICENAEIGEDSTVYESSVIGAGTVLEKNVSVTGGHSIWPSKYIESGSKCSDDIVWGEYKRISFLNSCIFGYGDSMLTPEAMVRIAASYAQRFTAPSCICIGSDGSEAAAMLKSAGIAGIVSNGINAVNISNCGKSVFANAIVDTSSAGGIYVECDSPQHLVRANIYGGMGAEADDDDMRSIEKAFVFGEQKPVTNTEIGLIIDYSGAELAYEAKLLKEINANDMIRNRKKLILAANDHIIQTVSRVLLRLGWDVDGISSNKKLIASPSKDTISIFCNDDEIMCAYVYPDRIIEYWELLCIIATQSNFDGKRVPLPVDTAIPLQDYLVGRSIDLLNVPVELSRRRNFAKHEGAYIAQMLEPEAMILAICDTFSNDTLESEARKLPNSCREEVSMRVNQGDIGRILRRIVESEAYVSAELVDGVRLRHDSGWVTIRPVSEKSAFKVVAGSMDSEYAKELCDIYIEKLKMIRKSKKST